jgi:hypothetical protein
MLIGFAISPGRVKVTGGAAAFDADAQAFFTAASITDSTQKSAVNQLVLDLKSYNIWTKIKALYPIVGGSASSHAVNLKTPGTYNLTFATGVTHSSTGMTGNGTSGYANTQFNTSTQSTLNNTHLSFYSRTNLENSSIDAGNSNAAGTQWLLATRFTSVGAISDQYNSTTGRLTATNTNSQGFYIQSRTASNVHKLFKNGSQLGTTNTGASGSLLNLNMTLLCQNQNGTPASYSIRQCAFASIGDGLTDAESSNFYTAVNTYQTTLSRNV